MVEIRKLITMGDMVLSELGMTAPRPVVRAVGMALILNPFAGRFVDDLRPLFEAGAMLGERLMHDLVKLLDGPAVSYGKGAIVGVDGEMEHGACVHPMPSRRDCCANRFGAFRSSASRPGRPPRASALGGLIHKLTNTL